MRYFERVYGEEWEKHYKARHKNIQTKASRQSEESLRFFELLIDEIQGVNLKYYIGAGDSKEYFIYDNKAKKFNTFDFAISELNIIVEFHGSLWHFNPNYEYKDTLPFGMTLEENKRKDDYKKDLAISKGFDYYVVFDTDEYPQKQKELGQIIMRKYGEFKNE